MASNQKYRFSLNNSNGQGLTEYLILLVLIAIVCISAATSLGNTMKDKLQTARERIEGIKFPDKE